MVIDGHNHYYARAVTDNIQHLTLGGGGAPLYAPVGGQPNVIKIDQSLHHTELDISGNSMLFTARRSDGTVIESITLTSGANKPPLASAGVDQNVVDINGNGSEVVTLNGSASSDPDGSISSYIWKEGATQIASGVAPTATLAVGVHTITLTVTDNQGATASDTIVVTVAAANKPPIANAGSNQILNDRDGNGSEVVVLDGSASSDPDGSIVSHIWKEGTTQIASGDHPTVSLPVGVHTLTLTVIDNQGAVASCPLVVTIVPCHVVNTLIPGSCYQSVAAAYQNAGSEDTIKVVSMGFVEELLANRAVNVTFQGGYAQDFNSSSGTSILPRLSIRNGTLHARGLTLR